MSQRKEMANKCQQSCVIAYNLQTEMPVIKKLRHKLVRLCRECGHARVQRDLCFTGGPQRQAQVHGRAGACVHRDSLWWGWDVADENTQGVTVGGRLCCDF